MFPAEEFPPLVREQKMTTPSTDQSDKNESLNATELTKVKMSSQEPTTPRSVKGLESRQEQQSLEESHVSFKLLSQEVPIGMLSLSGTRLGEVLSHPITEKQEQFLQSVKRPIERVGQLGIRPRPIGQYMPTLLTSLPEKALLNVLSRLDTESVCSLASSCRAHYVIGHRMKCLHFAVFLASERESLTVKMKVLNDTARLPAKPLKQSSTHSAIIQMTQAVSLQNKPPPGSEIRRQLHQQRRKVIPNGSLFKEA